MGLICYAKDLASLYRSAITQRKGKEGKRLLFICRPATAYGGGQQYLYRILEPMRKSNHNIVFAFPSFKESDLFIREISTRGASGLCFKASSNRYKDFLRWIIITIGFAPSFIHLNGYTDGAFAILSTAVLLKMFLKCKVCLTQHLSLFSGKGTSFILGVKKNRLRVFSLDNYRWQMRDYVEKKFLLRMADMIIFVDGTHAKLYKRLLGLSESKVKTIINGVDTDKFRPHALSDIEKQRLRRSLKVSDEELLIIGVGNLIQQKRFDIFLKVLGQLVRRGYSIKGLIVGTGPLKGYLEELLQKQGCAETVIFAGYRRDVSNLLNISDLFLMTSDDEGLPYALLEARACGLPTVATRVGGIEYVIRHGYDGYLAEPGDVEQLCSLAEKVLQDDGKRLRMGELAREDTLRRFSLLKMQRATMEVFKALGIRISV